MKQRFFLMVMGGLFGMSVMAQTFSGGDGSADSPYLIKNAADLEELATVVTGGNDLAGKMLSLENDITVTKTGTAYMIGYTGAVTPKKFAGTFDGKNHSISGLKLTAEKQYGGLFASITATGTVKDLTLVQPTIATGNSYSGFIAGSSDGTVENCHVTNGVFESSNGGYKGGVVGANKGLVRGCSFSGSITSTANAGGIVGQNYSHVESCHSSATIISAAPNQSSVQFGGITGVTIKLNTDPHLYDCYFTGNIEGAAANNCGGITGTLSGAEMLRCWNAGYISATGITGGLVNTLDKGARIKDCYNVGTVYNTTSSSVGGLIGSVSTDKSEMVLENSLNMGVIFSSVLARHEGMELAGSNIAGLKVVNSYFDSQVSGIGSKEHGLSTKELTLAAGVSGFDSGVWKFAEGMYPRLAGTADTDIAVLCATPFFLADGETSTKVYNDFTVSTLNDVEWDITGSSAARLNGSKVTVTRGDKKADVVLHAYLGNYEKRALVSVYPVLFEEKGTAEDPYKIENAADLMKLSDATNAQALDFTGEHFLMTGDIDMAGVDFVPMAFASSTLAFNGVFDGGGHAIKNLRLDSRTNQVLGVGLFSTVYEDGVIKNLTIDGSCLFDAFRNVAPFAAMCYGTVDNCRNHADVTTTDGFAGGIVYQAYGSKVKIMNCYNDGNITASTKNGYLGGIVYTNEGVIENCQNSGNVIADFAGSKIVAGISTINKGTITNVVNTGRVVAGAEVGGIVSDSKAGSVITNALSLGQVKAFTSRDVLGSAVGKDAGGQFKNVYYDNQVVMYADAFTGIEGVSTSKLTSGFEVEAGSDAWVATANRYPQLKLFAEEPASQLASMPVWFADGMRSDQLTASATLATADGLSWSVKNGVSFKVEGDKLVVTNTDTFNADELTASYKGCSRMIEVAALANLFSGSGTESDPYLIESLADLQKLSDDIKASGLEYSGKYFKLTNDIDMGGANFSPIAENVEFQGIFDGNNRSISNMTISSANEGAGLFGRVGSLGVIKNLTIDGKSAVSGKSSVGAFVGILSGTVDNCVNRATVTATASTGNVGGIVGQAQNQAVISNCVNEGEVTPGKSQVGGIVGYVNATAARISNVHNAANVKGTTKTGGIAGYIINAEVTQAENHGAVNGTTDVGGIAGYAKNTCKITRGINHGAVTGNTDVAGVLGYAYTDMEVVKSYNAGAVTASSSIAGGIIGRGAQPVITECFNAGDVSTTKKSLGSTTAGAGGLIGRGDALITDAYNVGTVMAEKNSGGIIGYYNLTSKTAVLNRVYQAGCVINTVEPASYVDVLIGRKGKATVTSSYYDNQVVYNFSTADAQSVSTAELTAVDMGDAWSVSSGMLPVLKEFASDDCALLYSAPVILAAGDNYGSVSSAFTVSTAGGVTWSGDAEAFIVDGDKVTPRSGVSGEYALTATLNNVSRTVKLTLTGLATGVESVNADGKDAGVQVINGRMVMTAGGEYAVYAISGVTVCSGVAVAGEQIDVPAGLYIVKTDAATVKVVVK